MNLSETLWRESRDLALEALNHPFVRGIGDGTLPLASFRVYVAQDAFFLESFARAYALALSRSPDRESMEAFAALISGATDELKLHDSYAREWGVSLEEVEPLPETLAYTEFLLATASLGDVGEICASMTPCMRLYSFLGRALSDEGYEQENPYRDWIETYSDPEIEGLTESLEALLDTHATDTPAVRRAYRRAMELEVAFFEAGYRAGLS